MGCDLTSGGQESEFAFGAAVCYLQVRKHYTLSFNHWCQKINEAAFLKVKAPLYSCLLITFCPPKVGQLIGICKPSIRDNPKVCGRPSVYVKLMLNLLI